MENHEKPKSRRSFDKRAVIYLRVAAPDIRNISLQEQEEACRKFLDQHNYTNIAVFIEDGGGSGSSENRS